MSSLYSFFSILTLRCAETIRQRGEVRNGFEVKTSLALHRYSAEPELGRSVRFITRIGGCAGCGMGARDRARCNDHPLGGVLQSDH